MLWYATVVSSAAANEAINKLCAVSTSRNSAIKYCFPCGVPTTPGASMAKNVVRERHVRALYLNIPVPVPWLQSQLTPPAVPDVFDNKAWVSVVVDDLFRCEGAVGKSGFMVAPGFNGWMVKVNALVRCAIKEGMYLRRCSTLVYVCVYAYECIGRSSNTCARLHLSTRLLYITVPSIG